MKQHVSIQQLNELTDKQKEVLREWWKPIEGEAFYTTVYPYLKDTVLIVKDVEVEKIECTIYSTDADWDGDYDDYEKSLCNPLLSIGNDRVY